MNTLSFPNSWYDLPIIPPSDIRNLIANVSIGVVQGTFVRSQNFMGASTWIASPFNLTGSVVCQSLHTDDLLAVAEAAQWTFQHQGGSFAASTPIPLRKVLFLRGGNEFVNLIQINLGPGTYGDLQLSYRDNATSAGDFIGAGAGSTPAILFNSSLTGLVTLSISVNANYGRHILAFSARDTVPNGSMFELECYIVP